MSNQSINLVKTARRLLEPRSKNEKKPLQFDLKRAVSTAYYALFHCLCQNCADCFIGAAAANRNKPAWQQAYRTIEHKQAKNRLGDRSIMKKFPVELQDFGKAFVELQKNRHDADYDPDPKNSFTLADAGALVSRAETAIRNFSNAPLSDRRHLAAWVALKTRDQH